jgi:hypothetical protein
MSRVADFCPKCKLYYPGECMKSGCQDRYCECDGCNAGEGVVFSKLSEKNTPSQSIVKVDPEGSCNKDNSKPVYSIDEIQNFYKNCFETGKFILSFILSDKEKYIQAKTENNIWSELTANMAIFNNEAFRMYAIIKHTFNNSKNIEGVSE